MYVIIGGNGFLGSYIIKNIIESTSENIISTFRENEDFFISHSRISWKKCDLSKIYEVDKLIFDINNIDADKKIIYLAAYHNPDLVEKNPKMAWDINITKLSYIVNKLDRVKSFFYPSTDTVYGNSIDNYHFSETDCLNPQNLYGKQKVVAESIILGYGYNVVRFPFLIGKSLLLHKKHFYDKIVESLENKNPIDMLYDSYRSSLDFNTAANILINIIENYNGIPEKVLNINGDADLSKYDIAVLIAKKYGMNSEFIVPINFNESNVFFNAKRAKTTLMDNSRLKRILSIDKISIDI